jgi:hypothetical protein
VTLRSDLKLSLCHGANSRRCAVALARDPAYRAGPASTPLKKSRRGFWKVHFSGRAFAHATTVLVFINISHAPTSRRIYHDLPWILHAKVRSRVSIESFRRKRFSRVPFRSLTLSAKSRKIGYLGKSVFTAHHKILANVQSRHTMQHNFEGALSLVDSQSTVPSDTFQAIKNLCQSLQDRNDQPSSCSRAFASGSDKGSRSSSSDDESNEIEHSCQSSTGKKFKPPSSKRQQLTCLEAAEIFDLRPRSKGKGPRRGSMLICKTIAPKYGVSPKTIRDIWRGRTWLHATEHLWTAEDKKIKSRRDTLANNASLHIPELPNDPLPSSNSTGSSPAPFSNSIFCSSAVSVLHTHTPLIPTTPCSPACAMPPAPCSSSFSANNWILQRRQLEMCGNPSAFFFPGGIGCAQPSLSGFPAPMMAAPACAAPAPPPQPPALNPALLRLIACGALNLPGAGGAPCVPAPAAFGGLGGAGGAGLGFGWPR